MTRFVHLQLQSEYSLLNSTCRIREVVTTAKTFGYEALALTDERTMYGAIHFYRACVEEGIRPIIGLTVYIQNEESGVSHPLVLLAMNDEGYRHLLKLSSALGISHEEGIPKEVLARYCKGLIAISPGVKGEIEQALLNGHHALARKWLQEYREWFSHFYLSLQDHGLMEEIRLNSLIEQFALEEDIPLVVTNNVHYIQQDEAIVHDSLQAIKEGTQLKEESHVLGSKEFYLKTSEEMERLFSHHEEALKNSVEIAKMCHLHIDFDQHHLPIFPVTQEEDGRDVLRSLCVDGLKKIGKEKDNVYLHRLQYELEVIDKMGFNDYFLIVGDFMRYAHEEGILTGPGRGSAAGSLVSYVLNITTVDPIQYNLLFERFLNPSRITLPDIDIDFPDYRRDDMIAYMVAKYGQVKVAQIVTFGTLAAKAAIRDVARIKGLSPKEVDMLSKRIPSRVGITLATALEESEGLQKLVTQSNLYYDIFLIAQKIEGLPRHTSTHAAGIIMSDTHLTQYTPLQKGHGDVYTTQYDGETLEHLGLLKMDFLGLRNLTLIENILKSLQRSGMSLSLETMPLNDEKTFALLSRGDTTGVFQLESSGMRKVLQSLKPSCLEDIAAVNALYRPGPSQQIPTYIERKHKREKPSYLHPDLEAILQETYGVIIYQEQIIQIASKLAGFSLAEADLLRRAVSKKNKEILDEERVHFVQGCLKQGYKEEMADELYDLIVRFANYGFNRSHAVAYSIIGYQLAYLKAHYPLHFFCALLTSVLGSEEKIAQYVSEAKQRGVKILPLSIHQSGLQFNVEEKGIRYPLSAIKGIGTTMAKEIIRRRENGLYKDLFDFCLRMPPKFRTKKIMETCIYAGAFDVFNQNRATLLGSMDAALDYASLVGVNEDQIDFFDEELVPKPRYIQMPELDKELQLQKEKEVIGFYLTEHPTAAYVHVLENLPFVYLADVHLYKQQLVNVFVYVTSMKQIQTKKKQPMAFFTLSDQTKEIDAVAFPVVFAQHRFTEGKLFYLTCKVEEKEGQIQLIIEDTLTIPALRERLSFRNSTVYLKIESNQENRIFIQTKQLLRKNPGMTKVIVVIEKTKKVIALADEYAIHPSEKCLYMLKQLLGEGNVVIKNK